MDDDVLRRLGATTARTSRRSTGGRSGSSCRSATRGRARSGSRGLEFSERNKRGFWEVRGYHVHAEPLREERYSYQEGPRAELER